MESRINLKVHWEEDGYEYMLESGKSGTGYSEYNHSYNLHTQGWEHVSTHYYGEWDVDMLHKKKIEIPKSNLLTKLKTFLEHVIIRRVQG